MPWSSGCPFFAADLRRPRPVRVRTKRQREESAVDRSVAGELLTGEDEAAGGPVANAPPTPLPRRVNAPAVCCVFAAIGQSVRAVCELLKVIEGWVAEWPPLAQPMRFGNKAFRSWHSQLTRV